MKNRLAVIIAAALAAGLPLVAQGADSVRMIRRSAGVAPAGAAREGELIVVFRDAASDRDVEQAFAEGRVRSERRSRVAARRYLVTLEPGMASAEAAEHFARMPEVLYAEPNGLVRKSAGVTFKPNDTFYDRQWNMTQVNAERTWGIQKGKSSVAVAVLDTGVAYEDYFDPGGRPGSDGKPLPPRNFRKAPDWGDTVFLPGYDFVENDAHPNDDDFHGTHVASTIAEATNNGQGVAGLAFGCAILPVKVLDGDGDGTFFDVAEGIDFAVAFTQNGAKPVKVINMSLGSESASQTVRSAVEHATTAGIVVVAAAGNSGTGIVEFPANLPKVVAVGALDARKDRAFYSNFGAELTFMAPGGNCDRDDNADGDPDCVFQQTFHPAAARRGIYDVFDYFGVDGTSMAAPHVAAAVALLFSQGFTSADAVVDALKQTAERIGTVDSSGRNDTYGYGLIRPANALTGMGLDDGPKK